MNTTDSVIERRCCRGTKPHPHTSISSHERVLNFSEPKLSGRFHRALILCKNFVKRDAKFELRCNVASMARKWHWQRVMQHHPLFVRRFEVSSAQTRTDRAKSRTKKKGPVHHTTPPFKSSGRVMQLSVSIILPSIALVQSWIVVLSEVW